MPLEHFSDFPSVECLNQLAREKGVDKYQLVADPLVQELVGEELYYEEIIYQRGIIPTRENNWHDLFNAAIWMLFPKSKTRLNEIHIEEIQQHGLNPRTPIRNRVTHFDECGGILTYVDDEHLAQLQQHEWRQAFMDRSGAWQKETAFFIFGHANYEMLLVPFLGLTAKYLAFKVRPDFYQSTLEEQYWFLDQLLTEHLTDSQIFAKRGSLKPLPVLGIPGWWHGEQDQQFYGNRDYFRPLRSGK